MYNLLIVDDEKIIREGIYELLSIEEKLELNLFSASSGVEAGQIMESRKIDIVLTDIKMPRMSGIELFEQIQERWPHCKVIFLTGYSEFDYVYKVHKHARYLLKAEEDEKIIEAVSDTIDEIENDFMIEQMAQESTLLQFLKQDQKKNRFLFDLFSGFLDISLVTGDLISRMGIDLDISEPIYYSVMRHETINRDSYDEQISIIGDLQLLLEKYFFDFMKGTALHYTRNYIVSLMQPTKWDSPEKNILTMKGKGDLFQKACLKNFDMTVSIVIGNKPLTLNDIVDDFPRIRTKLLMAGDNALLIRNDIPEGFPLSDQIEEQRKNRIKSRLELLDYYFDNSDREHVVAIMNEALVLFEGEEIVGNLFAVEIYNDIALRLIRFINSIQLSSEMYQKIEINKLFNPTLHIVWRDAFEYLIGITDIIFELKQASQVKCNDDVIKRVKEYIHENLSGDTSLDTLADKVGLSPEYLLRLFKKSEGITILQFINDLKIIKAKNLISDRDKQIKEIAYELGFSSSGYFGRFFKSKTGLSPQVYRDQQA